MSDKPTPQPSPESLPYWQAAAHGQLKLQRCAACHAVRHYPQPVCPHCYLLETEWIDASGRGAIHSWTVAHHPFDPAFKADLPYTLLIVDLEEGPRAMGRLDPAAATPPRIGLPVQLRFDADRLPIFSPAQ